MSVETTILKTTVLGLLLVVASVHQNARSEELPFAKEVDSCIAAVTDKLDLSEASRVRHVVTAGDRTGIGYVLTISTSVFSADSNRAYESYCVAEGSREPVKFRIDEI